MQVEPQTPLPTVYQITDHTDVNRDSYFVRAVMRDSLTGATLKSQNLVNSGVGTGRYTSAIPAPVDISGLGRQVDITITVYTDAGYTLKSELYQQIIEKWYVKSAQNHIGGGSSSGPDVDYKRIGSIFSGTLSEHSKNNQPKEVDLSDIQTGLGILLTAIRGITIPEYEKCDPVDLTPVMEAFGKLQMAIEDKIDAAKPEPIDLTPVHDHIDTLHEPVGELMNAIDDTKSDLLSAFTDTANTFRDGVDQERVKKLDFLKTIVNDLTPEDMAAPVEKVPEQDPAADEPTPEPAADPEPPKTDLIDKYIKP